MYTLLDKKPQNLIVCAGVNNISSQSSERIIEELQDLCTILPKQKVLFCTIPYPPKFCVSNGIHNEKMIQKISSINDYIKKLNTDNSQVSINLHNYGSEFRNNTLHFRYDDWKESSMNKKLHFSVLIKKQIAQQLSKVSFPTSSEKRIKSSRMGDQGHTSLPLAKDFIPKITPVVTAVCTIPGLVFSNNVSDVRKVKPHDIVVHSIEDKVNV